MDVKMNLRIITKNHADDSKIGSPLKIDFKAEWIHESIPTAWELIKHSKNLFKFYVLKVGRGEPVGESIEHSEIFRVLLCVGTLVLIFENLSNPVAARSTFLGILKILI